MLTNAETRNQTERRSEHTAPVSAVFRRGNAANDDQARAGTGEATALSRRLASRRRDFVASGWKATTW